MKGVLAAGILIACFGIWYMYHIKMGQEKLVHLVLGCQDPEYGFQCLRTASAAVGGGADLGECLVTAAAITSGDDESWYRAWNTIAERLEKEATASVKSGHTQSACSAFFRACNYYRTAEFFLHTSPDDPRIKELGKRMNRCFTTAIQYVQSPVVAVKIPFEDTTLPGYLCYANTEKPCPLLIVQTGFDGTKEELYFFIAQEAVKRGMHCLIFEGPGQGEVVRDQKIYFRPNWETVITPVVDYAVTVKNVDPTRIALMGISFGGYMVPRALAFDRRIRLGIANGGIYDFHEVCMRGEEETLLDSPEMQEEFDQAVFKIMRRSTTARWAISQGMYTFGCQSPWEWLRKTREYRLEGVAEKIQCPMLIVESQNDAKVQGQSLKLYNALTCPKTFLMFTEEEGAGEHCQIGAPKISCERIFNWIESQW
jgi:hypothetical protein